MPEWQVGEFMWMFLEGTKTSPDYGDVNIDDEEEVVDNTLDHEKTDSEQSEAVETEDNFDLK